MSKTIKIIDLLVRMHKKENLPRKIEISGEEYLYDNISETYVSTLNNQYLGHEISLDFCLNDKVVIIEEQEGKSLQDILNDYSATINDFIKSSNEFINKLKEK